MSCKVTDLPVELTLLSNPVKELYYQGKPKLLESKKISIVGTRHPISYTKESVAKLATGLRKRKVCVVSGGAMGVDAIAHKNSFPFTIGVMANSLDVVYPKVNYNLIKSMQEDALLLSEYEKDHVARSYDFVLRNRIVVALGEVLVIAEADENSGSIRSAEAALQQGKEIYVFPHRLNDSKGTNELLKRGLAKPIYDIEEFCDMFGKVDENQDEFLKFCQDNSSLEKILDRFGDLLYEYELDGKVKIENMKVIVV